MDLPRFNWTGFDLNESVNKWVGEPLSYLADVVGMDENDKAQAIVWASELPIIGDYLRFSDEQNRIRDYMDNTGLEYKDIKYPALLNVGQSNVTHMIRQGYNFVSKNIERLYR